MTVELFAVCFKAADPGRLASFWGGVLGREVVADRQPDGAAVLPDDECGFPIRFLPDPASKTDLNRMHFDLTSASLEDQQRTVTRALDLGGRHIDVGQRPEEGHVVLADPEGNEFCVIEPGNTFLAGCGLIGALACDGSQEVGYFWSEALGWPLVWDQGQETAIQSPRGGPKITWGGPPVKPQTGEHRVHFDLAARGDVPGEVERLVSLGASRADRSRGEGSSTVLADPDGNEFCVVPPLG